MSDESTKAATHTAVPADQEMVTFAWLSRAAKSGDQVIETAATILMGYYQGAEPDGETCAWDLQDDDSGLWQSSCDQAWTFIDGGPAENSVKFCHGCGKPVELDAKGAHGEQA